MLFKPELYDKNNQVKRQILKRLLKNSLLQNWDIKKSMLIHYFTRIQMISIKERQLLQFNNKVGQKDWDKKQKTVSVCQLLRQLLRELAKSMLLPAYLLKISFMFRLAHFLQPKIKYIIFNSKIVLQIPRQKKDKYIYRKKIRYMFNSINPSKEQIKFNNYEQQFLFMNSFVWQYIKNDEKFTLDSTINHQIQQNNLQFSSIINDKNLPTNNQTNNKHRIFIQMKSPKLSQIANSIVDYVLQESQILKYASKIGKNQAKFQDLQKKLMSTINF